MSSLFAAEDAAEIARRLQGLRPETRALWGKMDVAQMLAHCQVALQVALGEVTLKRGLIGILFGGLARKKLTAPGPFGKNLPTGPEFRITDRRDFAAEKAALLALVQRFQRAGPNGLTKKPHPFFGALRSGEWDTLQWKHLDHHLRQFGA
jgi:hypothetical protein